MSGVHVTDLPESVTEKQLKLYFSHPWNNGGRVTQILYPLSHRSAVITFEDQHIVSQLLQKTHKMSDKVIGVAPLPRKVFQSVSVVLEKRVSEFINVNPHVVEELQYIGDLTIEFSYEKSTYLLMGTWYQLDWAQHYLDSTLEAFDFDMNISDRSSPSAVRTDSPITNFAINDHYTAPSPDVEPSSHVIKKPNIPCVYPKILTSYPEEQHQINEDRYSDDEDTELTPLVNKPTKNKNSMAVGASSKAPKQGGCDSNKNNQTEKAVCLSHGHQYLEDTTRRNIEEANKRERYGNKRSIPRVSGDYIVDDDDDEYGFTNPGKTTFKNVFDADNESSGSDTDIGAAYYTGEVDPGASKRISFTEDTNFAENKRRPVRQHSGLTRGIDVAHTDFGDVPLNFTFDMNNLKVRVALDDITKQTTDAIVNPTSPNLSNHFGPSRAIVQAGGHQVQKECNDHVANKGHLNWAEVIHTSAGGQLEQSVGFILHTAGPLWQEDKSESATHCLVCTYINCLQYADNLWLRSIAMPLISAGSFGFPLDVCVQAFYDGLLLFGSSLDSQSQHLREIQLICYDQDTAMAAIMIVRSLLDCGRDQSMAATSDRYNTNLVKYNFGADKFKPVTSSPVVDEDDEPKQTETDDIKDKDTDDKNITYLVHNTDTALSDKGGPVSSPDENDSEDDRQDDNGDKDDDFDDKQEENDVSMTAVIPRKQEVVSRQSSETLTENNNNDSLIEDELENAGQLSDNNSIGSMKPTVHEVRVPVATNLSMSDNSDKEWSMLETVPDADRQEDEDQELKDDENTTVDDTDLKLKRLSSRENYETADEGDSDEDTHDQDGSENRESKTDQELMPSTTVSVNESDKAGLQGDLSMENNEEPDNSDTVVETEKKDSGKKHEDDKEVDDDLEDYTGPRSVQ